MNITYTAAIEGAAHAVAAAVAQTEQTGAVLADAGEKRQQIELRVEALTAERAEIVARRAGGDTRHDDGARLAAIAADSEGLAALATEADAVVAAARGPSDQAKQMLSNARQMLAVAEAEAAEAALIEHATRLDALLLATVHQLNEATTRTGRAMPGWGPTQALALALRKLQAQRREL